MTDRIQTIRAALDQLKGILRVHVLPADDALDSLEADLAAARVPGSPPYRVAGIPPGIISADDYDVTDEALAALARLSAGKETGR